MLTEDCDRAAFACVAQLAEELLPGCNGRRLVNEWRPLFYASPWCPEGKVRPLGDGASCCYAALQLTATGSAQLGCTAGQRRCGHCARLVLL